MCVIITLSPNATINKDHLWNAVRNNWHGYGLILRDSNQRIQVIKKFYEETDPQEVWDLLENNKDIERYLHVRYSTRGAIDESNVQPFPVYNSNKREVWFAHNGTLHQFGTYNSSTGPSDTRKFCEDQLAPALLHWSGDNGKGDYHDPTFQKMIVDAKWSGGSTGLFVSNDLAPLRIGQGWSEYKHPNDSSEGEVWVSNTSYFEKTTRGPFHIRLEAEKKKAEEEKRAQQTVGGLPYSGSNYSYGYGGFEDLDEVPFRQDSNQICKWSTRQSSKDLKVLQAIEHVAYKWGSQDDPKELSTLSNVTYEEWIAFVEENDAYTTACLLEYMADTICKLVEENKTLTKSKNNAQKRLQEIALKKDSNNVNGGKERNAAA